jgi:simple sugar transport system substrate-binding protein
MLTANPNLTAIYSACGPPALGAIQSIKNAGAKVILVGFDGSPDEIVAIKAGTESASVAQHPAKIGSLGMATLYNAVLGKKVPKNIDTGTSLITQANAK